MAAGWPDLSNDAERLVSDIISRTKTVKAELTAWRDTINATSKTGGMQAADTYQVLASYRNFMVACVGGNPEYINTAYVNRRPELAGFDSTARWAEALTPIDSFITWFMDNWPKKTTAGEPAFVSFDTSKELVDLSITFGAALKGQVVARLDAIIAALPLL